MDGVLSDFLGGALKELNAELGCEYTVSDYAADFGQFGVNHFYNISEEYFWEIIADSDRFWLDLEVLPYGLELYHALEEIAPVTILTTPNHNPKCAAHKLMWLDEFFGIRGNDVVLARKKWLLAGNGILIDDKEENCREFVEAGGEAILIPSTWNTDGVNLEMLMNIIHNHPTIQKWTSQK